jgi:hypothetical protein
MLRWLWRDQPVSVDVGDRVERSFNRPADQGEGTRKPQDR